MMIPLLDFFLDAHLVLSVLLMTQLEKWKACLLMSTEVTQCFRCLAFYVLMSLKMKMTFLVVYARILVMNHHECKLPVPLKSKKIVQLLRVADITTF